MRINFLLFILFYWYFLHELYIKKEIIVKCNRNIVFSFFDWHCILGPFIWWFKKCSKKCLKKFLSTNLVQYFIVWLLILNTFYAFLLSDVEAPSVDNKSILDSCCMLLLSSVECNVTFMQLFTGHQRVRCRLTKLEN